MDARGNFKRWGLSLSSRIPSHRKFDILLGESFFDSVRLELEKNLVEKFLPIC